MSNLQTLFAQIDTKLSVQNTHPFNTYPVYYSGFKRFLSLHSSEKLYSSRRKVNALLTKLQLNGTTYAPEKYGQGISEIVLYLHALQQKDCDFHPEKKITESGTDVDLQISTSNTVFNIEIKSPDLDFKSDREHISFQVPFRTTRHDWTKGMDKIDGVIKLKNNDTKVRSFLTSAQTKFCDPSPNVCNVLLLSLPITQISEYYYYIQNKESGIFQKSTSIHRPIMPEEFSKTNLIILSNIVDGHLSDLNLNSSSWDLSEYFTIMIKNPFSRPCPSAYNELLRIIPNSTKHFESYFQKIKKALLKERRKCSKLLVSQLLPIQDLYYELMSNYLSIYYLQFWNPKIYQQLLLLAKYYYFE